MNHELKHSVSHRFWADSKLYSWFLLYHYALGFGRYFFTETCIITSHCYILVLCFKVLPTTRASVSQSSLGCNDRAYCPTGLAMSHSSEEPTCPKFQPNIFDPSRCHDCLRQRHLHTSAQERTEVAPQEKLQTETETGDKTGNGARPGFGIGSSRGVLLTPIQSQAEEGDTSCKVGKKRGKEGGETRWPEQLGG